MILIGFMGCGKTTIARELAKKLNRDFIDLDAVIPELAQKSIPEIFAEDGESVFREFEYLALKQSINENVIIATGGGVITYDKSYELLEKTIEPIFFLNAPFENLYKRIQEDKNRPLGNQEIDKVRSLYESRLEKYKSLANSEISTLQSVADSTNEILKFIDVNKG